MNDENIAQLIIELDKLAPLVPSGNTFTSTWLENEYAGVISMRDQAKPSYRNEYRIIKIPIEARTKVLLKNKDKLVLFVPASRIIKAIEEALKKEFNERKNAKEINADLEKLLNMPL
ncbi:hypothetical protein ACJMK2_035400 [Sinanodonta woodiana]|uniref:Uncharacterized protein n=1 Tax=Sinanodonta woodiana TaxID=1069815 RepID=A0ABD3WVF3_SINWO